MNWDVGARKLDCACAAGLLVAGLFLAGTCWAAVHAHSTIWTGLGLWLAAVGGTWLLGDRLRLW